MGEFNAKIRIDSELVSSSVDDRMFGSFVEHLGRAIYGGVYQSDHASADESGFRTRIPPLVKPIDLETVVVRNVPALEAWGRYVRFMARHFRGRVRYFEIWNEWNIDIYFGGPWSVHAYLAIARAAIPIIREECPEAKIMLGSYAGYFPGMSTWSPEELAKLFPDTLGKNLHEPPGTNFGKSLSERPKTEWKELAKGVRYWQSPWEPR